MLIYRPAIDNLQDAYILGKLLTHPQTTRESAHRALAAYDAVRRPYTQNIQRLSNELGRITTWSDEFQLVDDEAAEKETASKFALLGDWVGANDLEEDMKEAEKVFLQA